MIVQFFKNKSFSVLFLIFLIGIFLWIKTFISSSDAIFCTHAYQMPFFAAITQWLKQTGLVRVTAVISCILLVLQAVVINYLNQKYRIVYNSNLHVLLFLLLVNYSPQIQCFHPLLIANFFLLFCIHYIFSTAKHELNYSIYFKSALVLSIGSLFYFPLLFFAPFVFIGISIFSTLYLRSFFIILLGLITPYFFYYTLHFLFYSDIYEINSIIQQAVVANKTKNVTYQLQHYIYFGYLGILLLLALRYFYAEKIMKIENRNQFTSFIWILFIAIVCYFAISTVSIHILTVFSIPVAFLLSSYLSSLKSKWTSNILFLILFGGIIYFHITA